MWTCCMKAGGDDLHSDFDTSGCDQKLIASLHTLEGDGWTLALTTGISSGPPIFGDLTPNSDGAYHYSYHGLPRTFRLAVATEGRDPGHTRRAIPALGSTPAWFTTGLPTPFQRSPLPGVLHGPVPGHLRPHSHHRGDHPVAVQVPAKADLADLSPSQFRHSTGSPPVLRPAGGCPFADSYDSVGYYVLSLLGPEFLIFIAEAISYGALIKEEASGRRVGYAACANAASFVLGYFPVHWLLPLLNWL